MADVEVGLGAVLGDEDLAVLERVHRAGVDVEVGVELLHHDPQTARGQQVAEAGGGEALAERGGDAPGDEDVLGQPCLWGQGLLPWSFDQRLEIMRSTGFHGNTSSRSCRADTLRVDLRCRLRRSRAVGRVIEHTQRGQHRHRAPPPPRPRRPRSRADPPSTPAITTATVIPRHRPAAPDTARTAGSGRPSRAAAPARAAGADHGEHGERAVDQRVDVGRAGPLQGRAAGAVAERGPGTGRGCPARRPGGAGRSRRTPRSPRRRPATAQASRASVSQPPVLIAAATHTPAVTAIAPIGSAPRYGLPTRTTPRPPTMTITTGAPVWGTTGPAHRHRAGHRRRRRPARPCRRPRSGRPPAPSSRPRR